jgi:transposase-like protein
LKRSGNYGHEEPEYNKGENAMPCCPDCHTDQVIKNGSNGTGKPKYACNACGRQFVDTPQFRVISDEINGIIDRLLLKKIPFAGIARAVQVSESWLQAIREREIPSHPTRDTGPIKKGRLTIECDELLSFVGTKDQKQWVWLAFDRDTREEDKPSGSAISLIALPTHIIVF